jgi:hypothetical protein
LTKNYCFVYTREKDEFKEIDKTEVAEQYFNYLSEQPDQLENYVSQNGSDAVLLFNNTDNQWFLIYAIGTGLITQRVARRKADSVRRFGIQLANGRRIGASAPLTVVSSDNIGDLSKSVQSKYLPHTDLRGIE